MEARIGPITREQVPEESQWDLSGLYASEADWENDFTAVESQVAGYAKYRGRLGESPSNIRDCLEFDMGVSRKLDQLHTQAHLRNDEDKTNSLHQSRFEKVMRLATRISEARSYIPSELIAIPENRMTEFLQDSELKFYRFHLEKILRFREHTLSEKEEALMASAMEMARAARDAFEMLDNADLKLGSVQDREGQEIPITHGNFQTLMQSYDRRLRRDAFETFYQAYEDHKYTFASLLAGSIKKDMFFSRARRYPSVREQALFSENIPLEVYDNLVRTVQDHLAPLYKYFELRKRLLGLDALHVYDTSVPLVKNIRWHMPYEESVKKISQALQPLGEDYVRTMQTGLLDERWVDRYENKGKRSGAYSSGCYDSNPFILMNYREDDINSLYTLAHEAGHSMHSLYSKRTQPYLYADYTIFVAEVASTFNEALLTRHLMNEEPDREMKIYLLCREIDNFRGTLYRQTMFAEFERQVYEAAENDQPMTLETFQNIYRKLLEKYFGAPVKLDDCLANECFRIPHFYFSFYVYKYATGISAAYALADRVMQGGESERNPYLNFLRSGGSQYPIDLLKDAGVDMTSPEPIATALNKFSDRVDQLESLIA